MYFASTIDSKLLVLRLIVTIVAVDEIAYVDLLKDIISLIYEV